MTAADAVHAQREVLACGYTFGSKQLVYHNIFLPSQYQKRCDDFSAYPRQKTEVDSHSCTFSFDLPKAVELCAGSTLISILREKRNGNGMDPV